MATKQRTPIRHAATFIVRILGTEHGDWRGQIDHVQSGRTLKFKNTLQALRFMHQQVYRQTREPLRVIEMEPVPPESGQAERE